MAFSEVIYLNKNVYSNKTTGIILAIFVCALWGSLFPCIKLAYQAFSISSSDTASILLFAGIRFIVCGIAMFTITTIKFKKPVFPSRTSITPIMLTALFGIMLHYAFTYIGLSITEGSKTAILKQIGFLFLSCFAFLFRKDDKFTISKLIAGVIGFLGIVVINMDGLMLRFHFGDALILAASICSVASNVVTKNAYDHHHPFVISAYSQFFGGIVLFVMGLSMGGKITSIDSSSLLIFLYICTASVTSYLLWAMLVKYNELSKLSVIKFSEPLLSVVFSAILLGEDVFKLSYLIALLAILASILLCNTRTKKA